MSEKDLPTQSSASGQTSGEVSRDKLSRRCVGHASGKPLPMSSFPTQTTTSGKPRLHVGKASPNRLYRAALLRNHFADTILKAREKHLKRGSPDAVSSASGNPRPFPDALLTTSGKPRPFPTHYLPFPMHTTTSEKPRPWEYPLFST
ncbi:transcription factor GTE8-like isoform X3 [Cucumis melo var. makuwa]|uniref:Transcription factor GTE8-like isoform X3 n=1 Tax=Cucumis melo var. makuwa TaxID=1194695 RepID=A0A5D3DUY8_CUCMM|nr:transcription factor GTE8-like isoform X3 [Cucumis melo var. makuwa]TYK27324.1 transcription factor GTE8-like isoform X3 [Cucumis melo var. makuwa]